MFIVVKSNINDKTKASLKVYSNEKMILETDAFIGKNGVTESKKEGDKKTPIGKFKLGLVLGITEINLPNYIRINENLYWVDDINSKYYNKLVDVTKTNKEWKSAEHLIEYKKEYEYIIEIIANPKNIKGKGSAIFLHCSAGKPTAGCIAINKKAMEKIILNMDENSFIIIK